MTDKLLFELLIIAIDAPAQRGDSTMARLDAQASKQGGQSVG
jgi:hypothetical protein